MNTAQIISAKRDGKQLSRSQIQALIEGFVDGSVPDYQMTAFAMAVYFQGMAIEETIALTESMLHSGEVMKWPQSSRPKVDKHSTGGIGDKVSLILAPALAACGLDVPMISGRGLGATGGTLDKLESYDELKTSFSIPDLQRIVSDVGCVIAAANDRIAPADQKLYSLRDVTGTVPSVPLITSSILSKKLAEGLDALVFDVKWGSGAFMKSIELARELAQSLVQVGKQLGLRITAIISDMNQPLGKMIGNATEVVESVQALQSQGPSDLMQLTYELGAELLCATGGTGSVEDGRRQLDEVIRDRSALSKFEQMIRSQGGTGELPVVYPAREVVTEQAGYIGSIDGEQLGWALIAMRGGRKVAGDSIDHAAGISCDVKIGDEVKAGQQLAQVYCRVEDYDGLSVQIREAFKIVAEQVDPPPLLVEKISHDSI